MEFSYEIIFEGNQTATGKVTGFDRTDCFQKLFIEHIGTKDEFWQGKMTTNKPDLKIYTNQSWKIKMRQ